MMDAGPFGIAHQHEDALGIDVSAFGQSFIVDPGRYTYGGGPFQSYLHSTRAHATVTIDGASQRRREFKKSWRAKKPLDDHFRRDKDVSLAVGEYEYGYKTPNEVEVFHRREVLFVDNTYWVVSDVIEGKGEPLVEQNFQYTPCQLRVEVNMATTHHPDANLAMLWLWPRSPHAMVRTGENNPTVGWYSRSYYRIEPAPHLRLSAELELPARMVCVLYPYRGSTNPHAALKAADPASPVNPDKADLTFQFDRQEHRITIEAPRSGDVLPNVTVVRSVR
jgi:hypothetical protein